MPAREIYLLSPRTLSPETIAVAFAKTSRSPESFRDIAAELSDEKSAQFHEKWVVGYGHASVAEHAVLHLALENISRVAIETIESNRLASYTEKSTRYQRWSPQDFTVPPELENSPLRREFTETCDLLFQTYSESLEPVRAIVQQRSPRRESESADAWDRRIRSQYVDTCRFILPAAANANVGMTANARVLEHAVRKMLSHELAEVRQIGEAVRETARLETPTLLKYADASAYLTGTASDLLHSPLVMAATDHPVGTSAVAEQGSPDWCQLIDFDPEGEIKILAAAIYRFAGLSFEHAIKRVRALSAGDRAKLGSLLLARLGEHDSPVRELEYTTYTFDLIMDQGAYAEFKRHRMMTQIVQPLTARLGFAVPRLLAQAGFSDRYEEAMRAATSTFERLHELNPFVAQYVVPNGFNRRVLARFNLREAYHFCRLRSARNAHYSIRRIAQRVYAELTRLHPMLSAYMQLPKESWDAIQSEHFTRV